jgi:hypothetical protein
MPIVGRDFCRYRPRHVCFRKILPRHIAERRNSANQVQSVGAGKNVEKAARGIGGEVNPLMGQLPPRDHLADQKSKAQCRG